MRGSSIDSRMSNSAFSRACYCRTSAAGIRINRRWTVLPASNGHRISPASTALAEPYVVGDQQANRPGLLQRSMQTQS